MKEFVQVPFPLNTMDGEKTMYDRRLFFEVPIQSVKIKKSVFITFSGFCMNNKGLIKECHHDYPQQDDYYLNEASRYYYDVVDHPENLITLNNEKIYVAIHHPWFNYYHWICESIFRLWIVRKKINDFILVLPEYYKNFDFIMGSLEPFKINNIYFIPNGKNLLTKRLCLPQLKPLCDSYNPAHLKAVRKFYRDYILSEKVISVEKIERLYVTRRLAPRRQIINENAIISIAEKHGFVIFSPENYTFLEQVAIFSNVKFLVGSHGSALTNMLFMDKKSSVLELHKDKTNELNYPSPLFWYMATPLEINYFHQICETIGKEDYFDGDYFVDASLFERNLVLMLNHTLAQPQ